MQKYQPLLEAFCHHTETTADVKVRDMWATPMAMIDDEGHKLLEACFGNPIGSKGTFGATNHPNTRIVAQSTLDYWNNKFDLSYKLVRIVGATWTILGPFRSKYLISMEIAKSEEDKPTKFFVWTYERFVMGADSNELSFSVCVPWDAYVLRTPKPYGEEWMETVDSTECRCNVVDVLALLGLSCFCV
ncbi:hypothetical protein SO802_007954 [Lithocarpus litseifolius]|uniref:Uncharacterized protein n=1 Tax=Lithocarpus litseifolius TaxID=425828 RepID=A0AAW2DVT8_9ROSI